MENEKEVSGTTVSFDPIADYTGKLAEVKLIDEKLAAAKGTMAEWQKKGLAHAEAVNLGDLFDDTKALKSWVGETGKALFSCTTIGEYLKAVSDELAEAQMVATTISGEWIKANAGGDETAALRVRRDELVTQAKAVRVIIDQFAIAGMIPKEAVSNLEDVPSAAKAATGGGSGKAKGSSSVSIYTVDSAGKRKDNDHGDLSRVAFYAPLWLSVEDLRSAMRAAGWDGSMTKDWEGDISWTANKRGEAGSAKVGIKVSGATDTPTEDVTPDEEEEAAEAALVEGADQMAEDMKQD